MANFNTYQTRNFYVAKAINGDVADAAQSSPGDIYLDTTATGEAFFQYRNADGLLTRSDLIYPKNIVSLKKTTAAEMDTPLMMYGVLLKDGFTLANNIGKTLTFTIHVREFMSYDAADSIAVVAAVTLDATNTASDAAFNTALAKAIVKAVPKLPEKPFKVFIGSTEITKELADASYPGSDVLVIVQAAGKFIRGKMSAEAPSLTFSSRVHYSNIEEDDWANVVSAVSTIPGNTVIPSAYALADLEYFALGERGDIYRGSIWPNNYDTKYEIDVTKEYNVLSIEYFWQGSAENVQKSPRMIQVACEAAQSNDVVNALYVQLRALISSSSSHS